MIDWLRKRELTEPQVEVAGRMLPVVLRRNAQARRMTMRLAPDGSAVRITLPQWGRTAEALEFGGVTVNEAPTFRADQMPYGGIKESGNTREGPAWAVREMTEERLVVIQL